MRLVAVSEVVVLEISVRLVVKSEAVELCHFVTEPLFPERINAVLFVPVQTVAPPLIEPATDRPSTIIVPVALTEPQPPVSGIV